MDGIVDNEVIITRTTVRNGYENDENYKEISKSRKSIGAMNVVEAKISRELTYLLSSGAINDVNECLLSEEYDNMTKAFIWVRYGMNSDYIHLMTEGVIVALAEKFIRGIRYDIKSNAVGMFVEFADNVNLEFGEGYFKKVLDHNEKLTDTLALIAVDVIQKAYIYDITELISLFSKLDILGYMMQHYKDILQTALFKVTSNKMYYVTRHSTMHRFNRVLLKNTDDMTDDEYSEYQEVLKRFNTSYKDIEFDVFCEVDESIEYPPFIDVYDLNCVSLSVAGDCFIRAAKITEDIYFDVLTRMLDMITVTVVGDSEVLSSNIPEADLLNSSKGASDILTYILDHIKSYRGFYSAAGNVLEVMSLLKDRIYPSTYERFKDMFVADHLVYLSKVLKRYSYLAHADKYDAPIPLKEEVDISDVDGMMHKLTGEDMNAYQNFVINQDLGCIHDHLYFFLSTKYVGGPKYYIDAGGDEMYSNLNSIATEFNLGKVSESAMFDEIKSLCRRASLLQKS